MKKSILILILLLINITESNACLNYYYSVDNKGHLHSADDLQRAFNTNFNLKLIESKLKKLERQLIKENDFKLLSDYSVLLLKAGKTKESLDILHELSKHYPNEYQIAANLGTAYELNGDINKAIQFIKRGIELNPNSHDGSEWVHIKVLETKLQLELDSLYLSNNSVLNLTEEDKQDSLVRNQILIQVRERFPFSPGPNPIMASILIDLGDCYANTASIEFAKVLYTISKLYYGANEDLVDSKINEMVSLRNKFSQIKPEKRHSEGDNIKLSGIRYKSMLDNNNSSNYKIKWGNILTNDDKLLSYTSLEKIDSANVTIENEETVIDLEQSDSKEEKKDDNYLVYYLLGGLLLMIIGFLIKKKRTTNNT
jgi:tetratricopeptide (TPR) repeat protein